MSPTESYNNSLNTTRFYTGNPENRRENGWKNLPCFNEGLTNPAGYIVDKGLRDAVNVALTLSLPLLVTGEPGTGKTQLAYSIAYELGFDTPLKFEVKSTTESKDLFYYYDNLGMFHAVHNQKQTPDPVQFITYNALGNAILRTNEKNTVEKYLPADYQHPDTAVRSIVLIDEIDKCPREVPNDLLNEFDTMHFSIPELKSAKIFADPGLRPVVIITSNSEKTLPHAFLRRCIFYHIPFPANEELNEIIHSRLGGIASAISPWLKDLLKLFREFRDPDYGLNKKPGIAELLNLISIIGENGMTNSQLLSSLQQHENLMLTTLLKYQDDQAIGAKILQKQFNAQ